LHYTALLQKNASFPIIYLWQQVKNLDGTPITPDSLSHMFHDFLGKNELPNIRFHDLRHTLASLLIHDNVSIADLSATLGHANVTTTLNIYTHSIKEAKKTVANKMNNIIRSAK